MLGKTRNAITQAAFIAPFNLPPADWVINPFRVDWELTDLSFLDTGTLYESTMSYDALNRITAMQYPFDVDGARKLLIPQYNRAGALESVQMDNATYVERIAYTAKGQRILISYGNGLMTRYAYHPQTFRLLRMRAESYGSPVPSPSPPVYHPAAPLSPLQEFAYEYDLVGNILAITDRTLGSGTLNNPDTGQIRDPVLKELLAVGNALIRHFTYDPVYRLISATGREYEVVPAATPPPPWDDTIHPIDLIKARPYTETYQYDAVGNMMLWKHTQIDSGRHASTSSRKFALASGNNQLSKITVGSSAPIVYQYQYDASGNLIQENTERHFEWDHSDRLRVFRNQTDGAEPTTYAQYAYNSSGNRVLKIVRKPGGQVEVTVYIDGVFEYQRLEKSTQTWENNSLHVMDNQKRIAIVRVGPAFPDDGAPDSKVKYQFGDHLGSSSVVVDGLGAWMNREEYLPYGETSFGSFSCKRYRFAAKQRDVESGLYYHGARYYAPWLATWTSPDIPGFTGDSNLYKTFRNNPLRYLDPTGQSDVNGTSGKDVAPPATGPNNIATPNQGGEPGFVGGPLNCSSYQAPPAPPLISDEAVAYMEWRNNNPKEALLCDLGMGSECKTLQSAPDPLSKAVDATLTTTALAGAAAKAIPPGGGPPLALAGGEGAMVVGEGASKGGLLVGSAAIVSYGIHMMMHSGSGDKSAGTGANDTKQPKGGDGEKYATIEEASVKGNHYLRVEHLDEKGNVIEAWFETSGPGGLEGHTESRALRKMNLKPGESVVFVGEYAPDNLPGGCHELMDKTARETGADIAYFQLGEQQSSARFYQGGVGHIRAR